MAFNENEMNDKEFAIIQHTNWNKVNYIPKNISNEKKEPDTHHLSIQNTAEITNKIINIPKSLEKQINNFNIFQRRKIFRITKVKKLFSTKKLGCPGKKGKKNTDPKKGKFRQINATPKIFNSCKKSLHNFIKAKIKNIDLNEPTINVQGKNNQTYWRNLSNKTIYEIYCDILPKRIKGDNKISIDDEKRIEKRKELFKQANKNEKEINSIINIDDNYYKLFKILKFKDFLKAYLNDETKIIKLTSDNELIEIDLIWFETYSQFFNFEYTPEQKQMYKNHVLNIIKGNVKSRKVRKK